MAARKPLGHGPKSDKLWADAVRLAVTERGVDGRRKLRALADRVVDLGLAGDVAAIKEIGDRLDGKPHQTSETVAEVKHSYVIETPAVPASVDEWQAQHGASRLVQ